MTPAMMEYNVPEHLCDGLTRWIDQHIPPGGFLQDVLCNDLREAFGRADEQSRAGLFNLVSYLWNHAPSPCWGSRQKVYDWCDPGSRGRLEFRP